MAQNGTLSERQQRAIAALLTERNITEAASAARVGRRTLQRWLADEAFRMAVSAAQCEVLNHAQRRLANLTLRAVDTLADCLESEAAPENRAAADSVFRNLKLMREQNDFEARLQTIEEKLDGIQQQVGSN